MVDQSLRETLRLWAERYNRETFIEADPIRFPHRFSRKQDIEISGFITAWIAYGRRPLILKKADELHSLFGASPYAWIRQDRATRMADCQRLRKFASGARDTCYRFYTYSDFFDLTDRLHMIYQTYESMEDALADTPGANLIQRLQRLFAGINGIPAENSTAACKRLAMFLRWMVRNDGIVDFGIWNTYFTPRELIIPLDTHVFRVARELNLINQKTPNLAAALSLTEVMRSVFPNDPCLADFSLFGYGIDQC